MDRVNVYDPETRELVGWFDIESATKFSEDTWFDGSNRISKATGSQFEHEALYRTAGGRWVLNKWSQWQGTHETWEFVSDVEAREWLIAQNEDAAVERYFGELEDERGPGRPEIGPAIQVRLPENLLTKVDARADAEGVSRAEMVRTLLGEMLGRENDEASVTARKISTMSPDQAWEAYVGAQSTSEFMANSRPNATPFAAALEYVQDPTFQRDMSVPDDSAIVQALASKLAEHIEEA